MKRSKAYRAAAEKIDEAKVYAPLAAVRLAKESASAKYDETVEAALSASVTALEAASARGADVAGLLAEQHARLARARKYRAAYRRYCWPVTGLEDYRVAPFHLLASEAKTHLERDHVWHMETLARLAAADPQLLLATPYRVVDLDDEQSLSLIHI